MRLSTTNLLTVGYITASSQDPVYAAERIRTPHWPFYPARTTATGVQSWTIDHGTAKAVSVWAVIRTNFATVQFQADDAPTFNSAAGLPQYDSGALTIPRNPYNERYQYAHLPVSTITRRYNRVLVPSQTPLDGAAYYLLGGLWAGTWDTPTPTPEWTYDVEKVTPHMDIPLLGGSVERLELGEPYVRLTFHRRASIAQSPVLAGTDELSVWFDADRKLRATGAGLLLIKDDHPGLAFVVRQEEDPRWSVDYATSTASWQVVERIR